jgi:hypothetical protein
MPRSSATLAPGEKRGGITKGTKQVRTIIRKEFGVTTEDQLKTLGLFIKGAGAVRLIRQLQTLKGFKYVVGWQIVAEYIMPKLQRITVEDNRDTSPTVAGLMNAMSNEDKLRMLELIRNASMRQKLNDPDLINKNVNTPNEPTKVLNIVPNETQLPNNE